MRAKQSAKMSKTKDFPQKNSKSVPKSKRLTRKLSSRNIFYTLLGNRRNSKLVQQKVFQTEKWGSNCTSMVVGTVEHYEEKFLKHPKYSYLTMKIRDSPDKQKLMEIYNAVVQKGGFTAVTATWLWETLQREVEINKNADIFELYKKYLFHYEKIFNPETALKLNYIEDGVTIEDLDPNYLIPVQTFDMRKPEDLTPELIK